MKKYITYLRHVTSILTALLLLIAPAISFGAEEIGFVKNITPTAFIIRGGNEITVKAGDAIYTKDIIKTDSIGGMGITFLDNTMVSIGPDTEYELDEYLYKPAKKKFSFVSKVSRGTLLFVSGNLAKIAPKSVKVNTPTGTVGVRGTRFLIKVGDDTE